MQTQEPVRHLTNQQTIDTFDAMRMLLWVWFGPVGRTSKQSKDPIPPLKFLSREFVTGVMGPLSPGEGTSLVRPSNR